MAVRNRDGLLNFWNKYLPWLGRLEKMPMPSVGRLADITAPALILAMAVGRIGDIINGEHIARVTNLWWGFVYSHPKTQLLYNNIAEGRSSLTPSHPAVVYEMIWDGVVLGLLLVCIPQPAPAPRHAFCRLLGALLPGKVLYQLYKAGPSLGGWPGRIPDYLSDCPGHYGNGVDIQGPGCEANTAPRWQNSGAETTGRSVTLLRWTEIQDLEVQHLLSPPRSR